MWLEVNDEWSMAYTRPLWQNKGTGCTEDRRDGQHLS